MIDQIDKKIYQPYIDLIEEAISYCKNNKINPVMLDAGCGHSSVLEDQYKKCGSVIGVDLDEEGLKRNNLIQRKIKADLTDVPLESNRVDIYSSAWVLEHIENPEPFVKEVSRLVKTGGYFVFIAPNKNSIYAFTTRLIPDRFHRIFTESLYKRGKGDTFKAYYRMNSEKKIDNFMQGAGFEKVKFIYNDDVKYFGFSKFTLFFARIWHKIIMMGIFSKFRVHIIGLYKKV